MNVLRLACVACILLGSAPVAAQGYPEKAVRMIVPFPAGGGSDTAGRAISQRLAERFGQPVVVENRVGAAGSIGADYASRQPADGYTILLGSTSELTQYPLVNRKVRYDPIRDFVPISMVGTIPLVLVVHSSLPVKSVGELIRLARARPGEIDFGSAGIGATTHLAVEHFMLLTKVKLRHVPYKGSPQASADLVAGHIQMAIPTMPAALPFIQAGRIRPLAVTTEKRVAVLPDVPTMQEAGVKGYVNVLWAGVLAPKGTPDAIIKRLNSEIVSALKTEGVRKVLAARGATPQPSTPDEFAAFIKAELDKWSRVVKEAGVSIGG
ncbi:MAG TPA: tripartite tricarboxylate transporter substrate binding protein [Burkholderiales bacterium]|jgi:tripartite-type tricarboxylate transporter receptor subunit TctC|nr:tripartite tricarboxylate transporter substrate binding protein [Burkholderiales bacterium]